MSLRSRISRASVLLAIFALQACKHPLAIVGEGDIIDANNSGHGCTLEQFQAQDTACTENEVSGDYYVNYKAEPRPGWRFVRWKGPCSPRSGFQYCLLEASEAGVTWWDETYPDAEIPPSTAVFESITGNTGFLVGPAVAGVAWETPTQQGVTGLDGAFQYEDGETLRFMIGDTLLGEVVGQEQVSPFDLAGSEVITGTPQISEAQTDGHPFHRVVNSAVLLQSLDRDGNPDNGIEITPEVAALFDGVELDLSEDSFVYQEDPRLRLIVRRANAQNLFTEAHGVVKSATALEHLYESMGVSPNILVPSRREWIYGADPSDHEIDIFEYGIYGYITYEAGVNPDGTPGGVTRSRYDSRGNLREQAEQAVELDDSCPPGVIRWQYHGSGDITQIAWNWDSQGRDEFTEQWQYGPDGGATRLTELDWGGEGRPSFICGGVAYVGDTEVAYSSDGVPEYVESTEYDANGNLTRHEVDDDGDGTPDMIESWQFNANGDVTRNEKDDDGDGTPETIKIYEYDSNGYKSRVGFDEDGDGDIDTITEQFQRNANGNVIRGEIDVNGDGVPEHILVGEFDGEGHGTLVISYDSDGDGAPNHIRTEEADENRRTRRRETDANADGIPEEIDLVQYHANGEVKRTEKIRDEHPGDGIPDRINIEEFDDNGNQILYEEDHDGDGKIDELGRWEYDNNGNVTRYTEDQNNDGTTDSIETWQYDDYGNLIAYSFDDEADGKSDGGDIWQYEYDANGRVTRKAWDSGNDGTVDIVESWEYDAYGNLLRAAINEDQDTGTPSVTTVDYVPGSWGAFFPSEPARDPREEFRPPRDWW